MANAIQERTARMQISKVLRGVGDRLQPGSPLRIARPIDADSLRGRIEGRAKKTPGGAAKPMSSTLQQRIGRSTGLAKSFAAKAASDTRQRAVVKVHYFGHGNGGAAALRAHARTSRAMVRGEIASRARRRPSALRLASRSRQGLTAVRRGVQISTMRWPTALTVRAVSHGGRPEDRRHFRIILAPEHGARLGDLSSYTRAVMARAEDALGVWLQWVAVDHWDTGYPHTHIILRGRHQDGRDLRLPPDFVRHGFRNAARDVATERLGRRAGRRPPRAPKRSPRASTHPSGSDDRGATRRGPHGAAGCVARAEREPRRDRGAQIARTRTSAPRPRARTAQERLGLRQRLD